MVGYDDPYNRGVTQKVTSKIASHAVNIDRLNGSGSKGGRAVICPQHIDPVTDPETGRTYQNRCKMSAAKMAAKNPPAMPPPSRGPVGASKCCANCKNGKKCRGGAADTPIAAKKWFQAEDQQFEDQVHQTITPQNVRVARMEKDLGSGKYAMRGGGDELSSNRNITPRSVAMKRAALDLGAGKFQGGARDDDSDEDDDDYEELEGGAAEDDDDYSYDDDEELEGGAADEDYEEPETLSQMKSICQDYEEHRMTGGAMTKAVRAMLPHGKKSMSSKLSKLLRQLKKRGRASFGRRLKRGMMVPSLEGMKHSEGNGRYVGGAKDHADIEAIHDSVFGGSKLSGGYGAFAPTVEALQGYDNSKQGQGLKPPPSVNQQPGMRGGRRCQGGLSFSEFKQKAGDFWDKNKGKIGTAAAAAAALAAAAAGAYKGYKSKSSNEMPRQQQQAPPRREPDVAPKMNMDDFMKDEPTGPLCPAKGFSGKPTSKADCKKMMLQLHSDKNPDCVALARRKWDKIRPECARMGVGQGRISGGSLPLGHNQPLAKKERPNTVAGAGIARGYGTAGSRVTGMSHSLIPVAQLPSKIGGGRFSKKGDYMGPSTGAIIPNLQSDAAPAGSGKMSRGAMVARLMKEKGISLAEASKQLKGGAYTANNFFMPKNIHDFFGAYS